MKYISSFIAVVALSLVLIGCQSRNNADNTASNDTSNQSVGGARYDSTTGSTANSNVGTDLAGAWATYETAMNLTFDQKDQYKTSVQNVLDKFEDRLKDWKNNAQGMSGTRPDNGTGTGSRPSSGQTGSLSSNNTDQVVKNLDQKIKITRDLSDKLDNVTSANFSSLKRNIDRNVTEIRDSFQKNGIALGTSGSSGQ